MSDILSRLQPPHSSVAALDSDEIEDLCDAAAQEIERLTAERDALRGLVSSESGTIGALMAERDAARWRAFNCLHWERQRVLVDSDRPLLHSVDELLAAVSADVCRHGERRGLPCALCDAAVIAEATDLTVDSSR